MTATSAGPVITGVDFVSVPTRDLARASRSTARRSDCRARSTGRTTDPDGNALMLHHRYAPRVTDG